MSKAGAYHARHAASWSRGAEGVRRRAREDVFEVQGIRERLAPYEAESAEDLVPRAEDELVERAATLLLVMPRNQPRELIERLLAPNDPHRGRRAVDALIDASLVTEDQAGRLRRIA
jgi:hypothetical protein